MTTDGEKSKDRRVTFFASEKVLAWVRTLKSGERSAKINDMLESHRQFEASIRAARLEIAELRRKVSASVDFCSRCNNNGRYRGRTLSIEPSGCQELRVTIYCECQHGTKALNERMNEQKSVKVICGVIEFSETTEAEALAAEILSALGASRVTQVVRRKGDVVWDRLPEYFGEQGIELLYGVAVRCETRKQMQNLNGWRAERGLPLVTVTGVGVWPCDGFAPADARHVLNMLPPGAEPERDVRGSDVMVGAV